MARTTFAVRFVFHRLPVEELRVYRNLRKQGGMDRYTANFVMWGRFTVHGHGDVNVRVVA